MAQQDKMEKNNPKFVEVVAVGYHMKVGMGFVERYNHIEVVVVAAEELQHCSLEEQSQYCKHMLVVEWVFDVVEQRQQQGFEVAVAEAGQAMAGNRRKVARGKVGNHHSRHKVVVAAAVVVAGHRADKKVDHWVDIHHSQPQMEMNIQQSNWKACHRTWFQLA